MAIGTSNCAITVSNKSLHRSSWFGGNKYNITPVHREFRAFVAIDFCESTHAEDTIRQSVSNNPLPNPRCYGLPFLGVIWTTVKILRRGVILRCPAS